MDELQEYERELLEGWESAYKKGQLTFLILLALRDGPKHMQQIKDFIEQVTDGRLQADDKSMYRALRRLYDTEMIGYTQSPSESGPDHKVYNMLDIGVRVFRQFAARNITNLYDKPIVKKLLSKE